MSRCFPFPPPGYEKKIRTDEADSLLKEKQKKEKKHKKDKEKKQGKERKDKETSKDKQKERKEKHKDKKRDKEKSTTSSEDKKAACVLPNTNDREQLVTDTVLNNGNGESKFIQDLARRVRDEEATNSQSVGKISFPGGVNPISQTNHRKVDEKRSYTMEKRSVLQVSSSTDQKGADVMVKPSEKKDHAKKTELHEKNHRRESVMKSDLPLDSEGINRNEPKYTTDRSSQEEKKQICHDKPKYVEGGPRLKERDVDTRNFRVHHDLSKASVNADGVLGKRKDHETNGFSYENGSRPNKMQRPVASPVSSVENGRKLGGCQTLPKPVSELQGPVCSNPDVKEHRINGFIDSQEHKNRPTTSSVKVKENGEASAKKRPHSDLKYLDQILNVPQREELREVDESEEQEWLFGQSGVKLLKKPRTDSTTSSDESLQVWNQALRIESTDLVALPYVVPF
ncbi:hypothetical protein N665_0367s0045 [Sinapis alba]|nr:hypothetical protein N665_0367s0045 [Sinapis alba]